MADNTATFAIELDTGGSTAGAEGLESALAKLKEAIRADKAEVAGLQAALKNLQGGASVNLEQFKSLRDQLKAKQASLAAATDGYAKLGGKFGELAPKAAEGANNVEGILAAVKGGAGPMGGLLEKVQAFSGAIKKIGATKALAVGAIAAIAIVAVALAAALVSATIAMASFALSAANSALAQRAVFDGMKLGAGGAAHLTSTIDALASSLPTPRKELEALAEKLAATGLRGKELDAELKKVATADAVKKFGSVGAGLLNLDVQIDKFHENIARIFSGVNIKPFLEALRSILSLFDQSTSSGKALKAIVEGLLNPLFAGLTSLAPLAKGFFQGLVIGALLLTIAVLKVKNALKDTFGGFLGQIDLVKVGVYAGLAVFGALAAILAVVAVVAVVAAAAMILVLFPFIAIAAMATIVLALVAAPFIALVAAASAAWDYLSGLDLAQIGSDLIGGLVDGIVGAGGAVLSAITGVVGGAIDAAKSLLGIHSHSKVFKGMGINTGGGFAEGVDKTQGTVETATEGLADAAVGGAARGGAGGGKGGAAGGGGNTYHVTVQGVKNADEMNSDSFVRKLAAAIEAAAIGAGRSLEPEPA